MGTVANEAFLAIEGTVAGQVARAVDRAVADSVAEVDRLVDRGRFDQAREVVDQMASLAALGEIEGALRAKFVQAALFGASQLVEPEEAEDVFDMALVEAAVAQLVALINDQVQGDLKRAAHAFIRDAERETLAEEERRIEKGQFAGKFVEFMNGREKALVNLGANLVTSRVISYGHLAQTTAEGRRTYQVSEVLDSITCPVCRRMHGRVFRTEPALARVDQLLRVTDPQELKSAAPFPGQSKAALRELDGLTNQEIQRRGWDAPPYHPHCRGILVKTGTVSRRDVELAGLDTPGFKQPRRPHERIIPADQPPVPAAEGEAFDAALYAAQFDDPGASVNKLLNRFSGEQRAQLAEWETRVANGRQTREIHKPGAAYTRERKVVHKKIIREILSPEAVARATPAAGEQPTITVFGGRGGSGKSYLSTRIDEGRFLVLDSDRIKAMLPEYEGWNAALVHEESSDVLNLIIRYARRKNLNVVIDGTLRTTGSMTRRVSGFLDHGYRAEGYYMFLPRQEAGYRAIKRGLGKTGRYVSPRYVLSSTTNERTFDALRPLFSRWEFYDNRVPFGSDPVLVASGGG